MLGISDSIDLPPPPRDCYHSLLEAVVFNTPQRRPHPPASPALAGSQAGPNMLDCLDDFAFSLVLGFVADCSQNYSKSLISMARMSLAYRRAYVTEKTFRYGDLVLSCNPALVPPPSWFHHRRSRIKSVTSAMLPADLQDALHGIVRHNLSVSFEFTRNESGEYPNIRTFSASIINSNPKEGTIATSKGWIIQGKGRLSELEGESRDLALIATELVAVARPDAEDNCLNERGANWYLMNSREGISHLLREPLLAERLGLPTDFGFTHALKGTLVFEDVQVEAPHHGNYFGLLLMKSVTEYLFRDTHPNHINLVLCWMFPSQFALMRDRGEPTAETVAEKTELWGKGMLRSDFLYSRQSAACLCIKTFLMSCQVWHAQRQQENCPVQPRCSLLPPWVPQPRRRSSSS